MASGCLSIFMRLLVDAIAVRVAHGIVDKFMGPVGNKLTGVLMGFLAAILALVGIRLKA